MQSFWKYEESVLALRNKLFMQRQQLQFTLQKIGLYEPSNDELKQCLESKYPEKKDIFLSIIRKMDDITLELMKALEITPTGQVSLSTFPSTIESAKVFRPFPGASIGTDWSTLAPTIVGNLCR